MGAIACVPTYQYNVTKAAFEYSTFQSQRPTLSPQHGIILSGHN